MNSGRQGFAIVLPWSPNHAGGVNVVVRKLYDVLDDERDIKPYIVVESWKDSAPRPDTDPEGRRLLFLRIRSPLDGTRNMSLRVGTYLAKLPGEVRRLRNFASSFQLTVVNLHYISESTIAWTVLKFLGAYQGKVVLSLHGTDLQILTRRRGIERILYKWAIWRADQVVVSSVFMSHLLRKNFDVQANKMTVIPNGIDPDELRALIKLAAPKKYCAQNEKLIVSIGTFDYVKGHDILIRAFEQLRHQTPGLRLVIAGRTGPTLETTRRNIEEKNLSEHCDLIVDASRAETLNLLSHADIVAIPSRSEGFSLVALEAGFLGKPVIASSVGGIPEIINNGIEGLLVPPENPDELRTGIQRLLSNWGLATLLGEALQRRVLDKYTASAFRSGYLQLANARTSFCGETG